MKTLFSRKVFGEFSSIQLFIQNLIVRLMTTHKLFLVVVQLPTIQTAENENGELH